MSDIQTNLLLPWCISEDAYIRVYPRSLGARYYQAFYSMSSHNRYPHCFQCSNSSHVNKAYHGFHENFAVFSCTKEEHHYSCFQLFILVSGFFVHLPALNQNDITSGLVFKSRVTRELHDQHVVTTKSSKNILYLSATDLGKI